MMTMTLCLLTNGGSGSSIQWCSVQRVVCGEISEWIQQCLEGSSCAEKLCEELKDGLQDTGRRLEWDECETLPGPSSSACGSTYSWLTTIQLEARYKIGSSIGLWPFHPVNWEKSELLKRNTLYNVCVADERQSWMRDGKTHQQWPDLCPIEEIFNFRWA